MTEHPLPELAKRTWHYLQQPAHFEVAPCKCGNHETQWSEFEGHLWCAKCEIDFIPEHTGVFSGPIPTRTAHLLGLRFDRFNMLTQMVERYDPETSTWTPEPAPAREKAST